MSIIFVIFSLAVLIWLLFSQGNKMRDKRIMAELNAQKDGNKGDRINTQSVLNSTLNQVNYPKFLIFSLLIIVFAYNLFLYGTFESSRFPSLAFGLYNIFVTVSLLLLFKKTKFNFIF